MVQPWRNIYCRCFWGPNFENEQRNELLFRNKFWTYVVVVTRFWLCPKPQSIRRPTTHWRLDHPLFSGVTAKLEHLHWRKPVIKSKFESLFVGIIKAVDGTGQTRIYKSVRHGSGIEITNFEKYQNKLYHYRCTNF